MGDVLRMKNLILRTGLLVFCWAMQANASPVSTEGMWLGLFGKTAVNDSVIVWHEFQLRQNTELGSNAQSLFRAGPLWSLNEKNEVGLLYGFVKTGILSEHRLTQQYVYKFTPTLLARLRFEQRVLEKHDGMATRFRWLQRYQHSLGGSWNALIWNEFFVNIHKPRWVYDHSFDRNRAFVGLRNQWGRVALEYGYLNQYTHRAGRDLNEHLAVVYFYY